MASCAHAHALSASQVVERLAGLATTELAAVRNYEAGHRNRRTILGKIKRGTPFKFRDKGSMAIINRFRAVTKVKNIELTGALAWVLWLAVHMVYLVGFRNRYVAVMSWMGSFLGHRRPHFHYAQEPQRIAEPTASDDEAVEAIAPEVITSVVPAERKEPVTVS